MFANQRHGPVHGGQKYPVAEAGQQGPGLYPTGQLHPKRGKLHPPCGKIDHEGRAVACVFAPGAVHKLIPHQLDGGGRVGGADQGFGQPHQRDPVRAGQTIFLHERIHKPDGAGLVSKALCHGNGVFGDLIAFRLAQPGLTDQSVHQGGFIGQIKR